MGLTRTYITEGVDIIDMGFRLGWWPPPPVSGS